jgi:hypothetical protein
MRGLTIRNYVLGALFLALVYYGLIEPLCLRDPVPLSQAKINETCGVLTSDAERSKCHDFYDGVNHRIRMKIDEDYREHYREIEQRMVEGGIYEPMDRRVKLDFARPH